MHTEYQCLHKGKQYYRVIRAGQVVFTGTKGECDRYIEIHQEKQRRDLLQPCKPRPRIDLLLYKISRSSRRS